MLCLLRYSRTILDEIFAHAPIKGDNRLSFGYNHAFFRWQRKISLNHWYSLTIVCNFCSTSFSINLLRTHIALSVESENTTTLISLYLNGMIDGEWKSDGQQESLRSSCPVFIGGVPPDKDNKPPPDFASFIGLIQRATYFRSTLTQEHITTEYTK